MATLKQDAYGRTVIGRWHLEIVGAKFSSYPYETLAEIVINGLDYHGTRFSCSMVPGCNPSVGYFREWIPCSVRPAEFPCIACDVFGQICIPSGIFHDENHDSFIFNNSAIENKIVAWMPLPEPYKGDN